MARASLLHSAVLVVSLAFAAGCTSKEFTDQSGNTNPVPDVNMQGRYTVSVTNRENSCSTVTDWMENAMSEGIILNVTQTDSLIHVATEGGLALYLALTIGPTEADGEVDGDHFEVTFYGTRVHTQGNCMASLNAVIEGTASGNAISGTVTYRPAISMNPDCAVFDCEAVQEFSGSRPPPPAGD